ncbi:MAG TPA: hypothetical protein VEA44_16065 [Caulobacter sp.]|nr:hypothetical protein [Caulobacter sp.]
MSGLALTKAEARQVEAMREIMAPFGLPSEVLVGGRHKQLVFTLPDASKRTLILACTPRDPDGAVKTARSHARRLRDRLIEEITRR